MTQDMASDTPTKELRSVALGFSATKRPTRKDGGFHLTCEDGEALINNYDGTVSQVEYRGEKSACVPGTFIISHWREFDDGQGTTQLQLRYQTTAQCAMGPKTEDGKWRVPGLTIEDTAAMTILRLADLNNLHSCAENEEALEHFRKGLAALERRRQERLARGVLNKKED